jgi:transcriptional regulator GlxA family with amidase domain
MYGRPGGRGRTPVSEKRQIAIVLYPGVTALDALGPYEVLKFLPDVEVRFVAHEPGPVATDHGILIVGATHSFDETPAPFLVLVPGSEANTTTAMADGSLIAWLKQAHEMSTWTTSVCSGALILAAAGLLDGKQATTHWWAQSSLKRFGAIAMPNNRIVRSDKIWTAAGVSAGLDLAFALFGEIAGEEKAAVAQLMIEYDPHPPFDSGHPSKASERVRELAAAELARLARNPRDLISIPKILWDRAIDRSRRG